MNKKLTDIMTEETDDRADLTPMIDCVFLLLMFFIVTSTFSEESLFDVILPTASEAEVRSEDQTCVVAINKNGEIAIGDQLIPEGKLWKHLSDQHRRQPIKTIVIKGDRNCSYEKAVTVMNMCHALKIDEVTLAVER